MFLNYNEIFKKIKISDQINIVASKKYSHMVEEVYNKIVEYEENSNIFILSSDNIICPLKQNKGDFFIILGVECPEHKFINAVHLQDSLNEEYVNTIDNTKSIIFDSMFSRYNRHNNINLDSEIMIVSKNEEFFQFYSKKYNCISIFDFQTENKMTFLTKRINIAEIAKFNKTFAIIFVHEIYKDLAIKIRDALIKSSRSAYTLFLRNIRYSRLITIENIDTIVLIDCPVFDNYNIDVTLPLLSPADVQYILSKKWDPNYQTNLFDFVIENSEDIDICKYEGAGKLILDSDFFGIEYGNPENDDLEIYEGRKGIASEYEHEE